MLTESIIKKHLTEVSEAWVLPSALNHIIADLQAMPAHSLETKCLSVYALEKKLVPSTVKSAELELKKVA